MSKKGKYTIEVLDVTLDVVAAPIGQPLPLHIGASPKILLAHLLPEQDRERTLQSIELTRFTPNTITDQDELRRCLDEIRAQGYAVDEEDFEVGVYAVGAPVRPQCTANWPSYQPGSATYGITPDLLY